MTTLSSYELQNKRIVSDLGLDPFSWYKQMRRTAPISIDEQDQLCELFRYKDIQAVLTNPLFFSSQGLLGGEEEGEGVERGSILTLDPPRHNKLRALVSQAFTLRAVARLTDYIRGLVNELLDASTTSGTLDVTQDLALPLSMKVITGLLGIPLTRQADFERWTGAIVSTSPEQAVAGWQAFEDYMRMLIAQKRQERQDDLICALLDAQIDGESLSEREILDFCVLLLGSGFETTEYFIGNAILCLDGHPSARRQLWDDPSLVPSTLEEVLRFLPIAHRLPRKATSDMEVGGKLLKAGYMVFLWIASANRDEERWSDPEVFDIRRSPNPHLSFGYGIHSCLGPSLARLETRIILEQLIERFKDIQRVQEVPLQLFPSFTLYGVQHLPVRVYKR